MKILEDFSDKQLLFELMTRNATSPAPIKTERDSKHYSSIIGIGNDHAAELIISADAYKELVKII